MRRLLLLTMISIICFTWLPVTVAGNSTPSTVSLKADTSSVQVNKEIVVTVIADPVERLFGVELKVLYDSTIFELRSFQGVMYSAYESEALTTDGQLYLSVLTNSPNQTKGQAELAKLTFTAKSQASESLIRVIPVKGVTNERVTHEVGGVTYPNLVDHPVAAGTQLEVSVLPEPSEPPGPPGSPSPPQEPRDGTAPRLALKIEQIRNEIDPKKAAGLLIDLLKRSTITEPAEKNVILQFVRETTDRLLTLKTTSDVNGIQSLLVDKNTIHSLTNLADDLLRASIERGLQAEPAQAITVVLQSGSDGRIEFSPEAIQELKQRKFAATIKTGAIAMNIPGNTLQGAGGKAVVLTVKPKSQESRQEGIASLKPLVSYEFELYALDKNQSTFHVNFVQPVLISWSYPADASPNLMGVYLLDEKSNTWNYVKERSRNNDSITVELSHFSTYALISYMRQYEDLASIYREAVDAIQALSARHIIRGISAYEFGVRQAVTRAEWTTMLVRALGLTSSGSYQSDFVDVSTGEWYSDAINIAYERGLISGYTDGTFRPDSPISRAELAVLLSRLPGNDSSSTEAAIHVSKFKDHDSIPSWAEDAIYKTKAKGWLQGDEANQFNPAVETIRADAAVVLYRLLNSDK